MASNKNNNNDTWIAETVCDFIHSPIWTAPIHTFIEANCAAFDFDDDISPDDDDTASMEEKMHIHRQYEHLVDSLIGSLGQDLGLDPQALKHACQSPSHDENWANIDESYEQLYSAKDFEFFEEMMKRKNLILQLQAIVNLQLRWGLLKQSDTADDFILSLLLQATTIPSQRGSISHAPQMVQGTTSKHELPSHPFKSNDEGEDDDDDDVVVVPRKQSARRSSRSPPPPQRKEPVEPRKTPKAQYQLPDLRHKGGSSLNADWYRNLPAHDSKTDEGDDDSTNDDPTSHTSTNPTINNISGDLLREKLRQLTVSTASAVDDETASAMKSRKNFLQQQRDLLVQKQRDERAQDLEQETRHARPQSAANVARRAMGATNDVHSQRSDREEEEEQQQISAQELAKRRAMAEKIKRGLVNKR